MPELPEVETIKRDLKVLEDRKIIEIYRSDKKMRITSSLDLQELVGFKIVEINRQARYLLLKNNNQQTLIIHLGMSGRLIISDNFNKNKHDHFACQFTDGKWLIFNDPRRFGFIDLVLDKNLAQHKMLSKLSLEPLAEEFNWQYLRDKLSKKNLNIKTAIMDNKIVVGVGNIYASESLFDAQISPLRNSCSLSIDEIKKLVTSIKKIIAHAIDNRGSSISDYVDTSGSLGNFQNNHQVYNRAQNPCLICETKIERLVQNGRASYYCPNCQS